MRETGLERVRVYDRDRTRGEDLETAFCFEPFFCFSMLLINCRKSTSNPTKMDSVPDTISGPTRIAGSNRRQQGNGRDWHGGPGGAGGKGRRSGYSTRPKTSKESWSEALAAQERSLDRNHWPSNE